MSSLAERERKKDGAIGNTVNRLKGKTNKKQRLEIVLDNEMMNALQEKAKSLGIPKATYVKLLISQDLKEQ